MTQAQQRDTILQSWDIPGLTEAEVTHIAAEVGKATIVVGANGAGKSALGWRLENTGNEVQRIVAHRRLWFEEDSPDISPSQHKTVVTNMKNWSTNPSSRYIDHANQQRIGIVLYDLLALYDFENAKIADAARSRGSIEDVSITASVLDRLNAIFTGVWHSNYF